MGPHYSRCELGSERLAVGTPLDRKRWGGRNRKEVPLVIQPVTQPHKEGVHMTMFDLMVVLLGAVVAVGFLCCVSPTVRKDVARYFDLYSSKRKDDVS